MKGRKSYNGRHAAGFNYRISIREGPLPFISSAGFNPRSTHQMTCVFESVCKFYGTDESSMLRDPLRFPEVHGAPEEASRSTRSARRLQHLSSHMSVPKRALFAIRLLALPVAASSCQFTMINGLHALKIQYQHTHGDLLVTSAGFNPEGTRNYTILCWCGLPASRQTCKD
jgi:hypothetical protein